MKLHSRKSLRRSGQVASKRHRPCVESLEQIRLLTTWVVNSSNTSGTNDPTEMTFYDALYYAKQAGGGTIDFDIVPGTTFTDPDDPTNTWTNGSGPYDVTPINENVVTVPITIDGTTQPGFAPGNPQIYVDGDIPNFAANLQIEGGNSTVEGLGFIKGVVLGLENQGGDSVRDCVFGVGPNGQATSNGFNIGISSANNTIGGTTAAAGNIISGSDANPGYGIDIYGAGATGNLVQGNHIGSDATGQNALPNAIGILIEQAASNNTIGGTASGAGNVIAFNSQDGVEILPPSSGTAQCTGDAILGNEIYGNGKVGIDLGGTEKPLPNDSAGHVGPNDYQDFPIVSGPNSSGAITGSLSSPAGSYRVEYFADYPAGTTPGQVFLGEQTATIGSSGSVDLSFTPPSGTNLTNATIVATATSIINNVLSNTSEITFAGLIVNTNNDDELSQLPPGELSLRGAIETVDNDPSTWSGATISFNIPGGGIPEIDVTGGPLPEITTPIFIDGTTQPGTGQVEVNGKALSNANGLVIPVGHTTVSGLIVVGFLNGIVLQGAGGNTITGNVLGNNVLGNSNDGLWINNSPNNLIGGTAEGDANVISGNGGNGVEISGTASVSDLLEGNYIGTNTTGDGRVANGGDGVLIDQGAANDLVGGSSTSSDKLTGAGNLISGNTGSGVLIEGQGTGADTVAGNFIGTDVNGTMALGNGGDGITIEMGASSNFLGGVDTNSGGSLDGLGNLISANTGNGILITGTGTTGMQIEGNYIGTDLSGSVALGNGADGIHIDNGAANNVVGGPGTAASGSLAGAGNLISGNGTNGVEITGGTTTGSNGNTIEGNFIGTNGAGLKSVPNQQNGVRIMGSSGNQVGGTVVGTGNLISGNGADGIGIIGPETPTAADPGANSNVVIGNVIGLNLTREAGLSNAGNGLTIAQATSGNLVGVDTQGDIEGNVISDNRGDGILVAGAHATQNVIEASYIGADGMGRNAFPNATGVVISGGASNNSIGGTAGAAANLISGNASAGVMITGPGTSSNQVINNLIGTESNGSVRLDNRGQGVVIENQASNNQIGASGVGNVISGNTGDGIEIIGSGTSSNNIVDNMIGVDMHGNDVANDGNGVLIQDATNNHVGGAFNGDNQGNTIENNVEAGVLVTGTSATGDSILNNTFANNGGLPIDLEQGANGGINPPLFTVLVGANGGGSLTEDAQVQGSAGATYEVQFSSSPTRQADTLRSPTAHFVSSVIVTVTDNGFVNTPLPGPASGDNYILMTLTDQNGNTSEFSFSLAKNTLLDQGTHLTGGEEDTLKANKSVIIVGQTLTATDIITINQASTPKVAQVRLEASKKRKSKSKITPTGTVYFDDGNTRIGQSRVKVVHGLAEANAKLKLTMLGTQTIYAVYQPDAKGLANGLTPTYTSLTVTVDPATKTKKGHGKAKDVLAAFRVLLPARAVPAGPRALARHR